MIDSNVWFQQFDTQLQMEMERLLVQEHALEQQKFLACGPMEDSATSQRARRKLVKLVPMSSLWSWPRVQVLPPKETSPPLGSSDRHWIQSHPAHGAGQGVEHFSQVGWRSDPLYLWVEGFEEAGADPAACLRVGDSGLDDTMPLHMVLGWAPSPRG